MDLKKIMALAMMALMVIPSMTVTVGAVEEDMACAIERAQIYLDKVITSAEKTASLYPEGHIIHEYLDEIYELLGQDGENGPDIRLQTDFYGTAKMKHDKAHGNYVFLSDGGVGLLPEPSGEPLEDFGMGRVVIKGVDTLLDDIATLSYDFYYTFPDSIIYPDFQAFPYMVLECDADGGDDADLWIVLISTQIEHDAHTNGEMPPLKTWTTWTLAGYDNWHSTGPVGEPTAGVSLAAMKTGYPLAKVLNVKVAVGEWAMGNYEAITGCVDDIEINGDVYDFEEEPEVMGAEGLLDQASDYLDAGDFKSAAKCLSSARNILGRINGLLRSMAKAHKVTRTEKFERRIQGIRDKIERRKGPK